MSRNSKETTNEPEKATGQQDAADNQAANAGPAEQEAVQFDTQAQAEAAQNAEAAGGAPGQEPASVNATPSGGGDGHNAAPPELSPEQVEELLTKATQAEQHWERLVRLSADFDNYKKRAARERQDAIRYANESLLEKLVPVIDNFGMALAATEGAQGASVDSLKTGVQMIYGQLKNIIEEAGLEEIDAAGKPFDPNLHEAVSQQESAEVPEGHVLQQLRKGYKLRERLLRPATVIVAKKPAQ